MYSESVYDVNYEWKGKIVEETSFSIDYDGLIPFTYFHAEVIEDYNDQPLSNVVIAYYGGYIGNDLYLLKDMVFPEISQTYYFYNSKLIEHAVNNRNIMHTHLQNRVALGTLDIIYFRDKWR